MNILYIMRYWPVYGGGETITATLANEFVRRGHNVFIAYQYDNVVSPMPYEVDSRIKTFKTHTIEKFGKNDVMSLHNYIINNNIDVMINQWGDSRLCAKAKKGTNCRLVICWHLDVLRKYEQPVTVRKKVMLHLLGEKLYQKYTSSSQMREHDRNYKLSDKYIFLSDSFLKEYIKNTNINVNRNKVGAIPNPLTYHYFYDMNKFDTKEKEVLFVGRIYEYHKRLSYILNIWKKIERLSEFDGWHLTIVGDGPDMESTQEMAERFNLRRISFEGFKNPRPYYERASIFVMTSAFEGFGMTLVEAQQYGVVPMAMDTYGSLHDIITDGLNGVIIKDNDLDEYFIQLKKLMGNYDLRKKYAIEGLKTCSNFSSNTVVDRWEHVLSGMLNDRI